MVNGIVLQVEIVDWCVLFLAPVCVAQGANDVDTVADESGTVKVSGWKDVFGIAEDLNLSIRVFYDDVVVDEEIWVVVIFMFTSDENRSTIFYLVSDIPKRS
ncbi:hypothetical protein [Rubritalea tangerina]|uniref:hypothetical protein n=1 Tax=Rubritalea tangerina TaxID=430798 RepID=UPI00360A2870